MKLIQINLLIEIFKLCTKSVFNLFLTWYYIYY